MQKNHSIKWGRLETVDLKQIRKEAEKEEKEEKEEKKDKEIIDADEEEDFENSESKKLNKNMFFEQDGASSRTSKKIKKLLEELFGNNLIQNAPHSPDIIYPIETLWAELKKNLKERRAEKFR